MVMTVQQVMTTDPIVMSSDSSASQAARIMSDRQIGTVVVMDHGRPFGMVTDRDITLRVVAAGKDPSVTAIAEICSREIASVRPDQPIDDATKVMKSHDVKRILVMADDRVAGIISLGDLAARGEGSEVQPDLSQADPNN